MKPIFFYISHYGKRLGSLLLLFLKAIGTLMLIVLGVLILALQIPAIQTMGGQALSKKLSQKLKYTITIEKIRINWVDMLRLQNLRVLDREGKSMIFFREVEVDFSLSGLSGRNIFIDEISASGGNLHIRRSKQMSRQNIADFGLTIDSLLHGKDTTRSKNPPVMAIERISIHESNLMLDDERQDSLKDRFDYYHIGLDNIDLVADNFRSRRDTIEFQMSKFETLHALSGLKIHDFQTFFRYTKHNINLFGLKTHLGNSYFSDTLVFNFDTPDDFTNFNHKIKIKANLTHTKIAFSDLVLFAPSLRGYTDTIRASGQFRGSIDNFLLKNMLVGFGKKSFLAGKVSLRGLPKLEETFADIKLKNCLIDPKDLAQYISSEQAYQTSLRLGQVSFYGDFIGFTHDFVANGRFDTDLGSATTDLRLAFLTKKNIPHYEGKLETEYFDLGTLLKTKQYIRRLTMKASINGSGFDLKTAKLKIDADIKQFQVREYDYKNLKADAKLSHRLFEGSITSADTNLKTDMYGKVDLSKENYQQIDITGQIAKANLYKLGFVKTPLILQTQADLHLTNSPKEGLLGRVSLNDFVINQNGKIVRIANVQAYSELDNTQKKSFALRSDIADIDAEGNFSYQSLYESINYLVEEYQKAARIKKSNKSITNPWNLPTQNVYFSLDIKKANPLIQMFAPQISLSNHTKISGNFNSTPSQSGVELFVEAYADTIRQGENIYITNQFEIASSKARQDTSILAELYFFSKKNRIKGLKPTQNLLADMSWQNNKIKFRTSIDQQKSDNHVDINGIAHLLPGQVNLVLQPSQINLIGQRWIIDPANSISIQKNYTQVSRLTLSNGSQNISLEGQISKQANHILHLAASGMDLALLDSLSAINISGKVFANIDIARVLAIPEISGHILADSLGIGGFLVGNLQADASLDQHLNRLKLLFNVDRGEESRLHGQGFYYLDNRAAPLDMAFTLDRVSLGLLEPFLKQNLSAWKGTAAGYLSLSGSLSKPLLNGEVQVNNGGFTFNLLKTRYNFDDKIIFLDDEINLDNIRLIDQNNNYAQISRGAITHTNFTNFGMNVNAKLRAFQVMNLNEKDNKMYYGTANVTGDLRINGLFSNLDVRANVRSEKGTRIFIPIQQNQDQAVSQDFISFKTSAILSDTTAISADTAGKMDLTGLNLDFSLDITPDAYCEIIFDKKAGDIIKATGTGKIKLGIDTRGSFNMFGQYFINKGTYNFTLKNFASKEFEILPGGSVSWNGDPLGALLNLSAIYQANVRLSPLVSVAAAQADTTLLNQPEVRRNYPVNVNLNLEGNMLSPHITVGINILNYPAILATYITAFKSRIQTDEQELNRQVFSLLIFRSFMTEGGFSTAGISSRNSISELVSNQLSGWLSQVNENIEVDINMNGLSQEALSTLRARLSYTMLNGRLRVTRDGTFTNTLNQATTASVVGDWTVEYMLNKDGSLRAKLFHRNNPNNVVGTGLNTNFTQQGFGIFHTKSFDSIGDIFRRKKKKIVLPAAGGESEAGNME